ncbi:lysylphosphatidylglycerol synthase domain-containing protein [Aurantibacter aestuarii]|uniref:lysylphosphatidylglycerol synthase domain-containing protein n=1 Tax=Aurantibacter aestuarii TaxID=1266046 RepID=UPI0015E66BA5|nr:lysylphosphatidylglycerol synthase domain-containing protein [Aurantibacter aestuarii]
MQGKLIESTLSYKSKQIFFVLVKLIVVIAAFYIIYAKVFNDQQLSFLNFKKNIEQTRWPIVPSLMVLVLFSFINWILELLKWQLLAKPMREISFAESFKQSLFSLTASLITPNRIGEYGAKALFYKKSNLKKCLSLNLIGNLSQLAVTVFFGIIGCLILWQNYSEALGHIIGLNVFIIILIVLVFGVGALFLLRRYRQLSYNTHSKTLLVKTLGLSLCRYVAFNLQFYVLLILFNFEIDVFTALSFTSSMYLLASIIPAISLFDVVIKGSISVYLFSLLGFNSISILSIVLIMWLLNFAIPAIIGSYFVLTFKQKLS